MVFTLIAKKIGGYNTLRQRYGNSKIAAFRFFYVLINRGYNYESNSYLPFNNLIKGEINFPHGISGVYLSGDCVIGSNCTIYQQVTIGSNMLLDSKGFGSPLIGNNVLIGAGAKIIGNVSIGNNCRIGANAVVTKDIPENSVVVAGNQIVIQKSNLENKIYQNHPNGWAYLQKGKLIFEKDLEKIKKLNTLKIK